MILRAQIFISTVFAQPKFLPNGPLSLILENIYVCIGSGLWYFLTKRHLSKTDFTRSSHQAQAVKVAGGFRKVPRSYQNQKTYIFSNILIEFLSKV